MSILLITNQRDLTSDFLVRELATRKLDYHRLNTDALSDSQVTIDPASGSIRIANAHSLINTESVSVAYLRRPEVPLPNQDTPETYRDFVSTEWGAFLKALYLNIGHRWFSHPSDILLAEDKSRQIRIAHQIGFNVPETVITNDVRAAQHLIDQFPLIAKPLKCALIDIEDAEKVIFTSSIETLTKANRSSIAVCPVIFQRQIVKTVDIRVTVVGNQVFPVSIHSQETEETKVDWRRGVNPNLRHEVIELSRETREKCIQIVQAQSLRFGAIDLVQDADGKLWFLECNPNGQWAWIENRTGLPIAAAIIDEMMKLAGMSCASF